MWSGSFWVNKNRGRPNNSKKGDATEQNGKTWWIFITMFGGIYVYLPQQMELCVFPSTTAMQRRFWLQSWQDSTTLINKNVICSCTGFARHLIYACEFMCVCVCIYIYIRVYIYIYMYIYIYICLYVYVYVPYTYTYIYKCSDVMSALDSKAFGRRKRQLPYFESNSIAKITTRLWACWVGQPHSFFFRLGFVNCRCQERLSRRAAQHHDYRIAPSSASFLLKKFQCWATTILVRPEA